jgi:hypothetical protein
MNSGRLIHKQPLATDLTLELWDHSRPVSGERWHVLLKEEHNFIAASEMPGLLKDMQYRILELARGYFGPRGFGARCIRKTYAAYRERPPS